MLKGLPVPLPPGSDAPVNASEWGMKADQELALMLLARGAGKKEGKHV